MDIVRYILVPSVQVNALLWSTFASTLRAFYPVSAAYKTRSANDVVDKDSTTPVKRVVRAIQGGGASWNITCRMPTKTGGVLGTACGKCRCYSG